MADGRPDMDLPPPAYRKLSPGAPKK